MSSNDDFTEPAGAGNFLQRYHQMRAAAAANSTSAASTTSAPKSTPSTPNQTKLAPVTPPSPTSLRSKPISISRTEAAKNVWGQVFHPLGRSPKSADRYDLGRGKQSDPGHSASELHAKGTGISLDDRQID